MEKLNENEKKVFKELSNESFLMAPIKKKLLVTLEEQKLITFNHSKTIKMKKYLLQIAASIILLLSSYFLGMQNANKGIVDHSKERYALFLYENEEFTIENPGALIQEYSGWAKNLAKKDKLVFADKLNDSKEHWLGKVTVKNDISKLTGYFVFYANDFEEATKIASSHPHTKYGGGVELRAIDRLDR